MLGHLRSLGNEGQIAHAHAAWLSKLQGHLIVECADRIVSLGALVTLVLGLSESLQVLQANSISLLSSSTVSVFSRSS